MSDDDKHLLDLVLEDVNDKFRTIMEGQAAMGDVPARFDRIDERLQNVESDIRGMKLALTDLSQTHDGLAVRVTVLEQKAA